jgi:hypothetical protein
MLVGRETEEKITHPTAADLLREFNAPAGIATTARDQVARAGRDDAAKYTTEQLLGQFSGVGPEAIAVARELGPVTVDYFGRAVLPLAEAVSIGVVEATVHLLDVLRALGRAPDVPEAGLALTAEVIARIAPAVEFIEAATGRAATDLFPVMS